MDNSLTLAITKVGDILLQSRITKDCDGKPIESVSLNIPPYQRPYKWTAKNAIQLLDDIMNAKSENKEVYRVGTLILHKRTDDKAVDHYDIVDGQQRTITFALLLKALGEQKIPFLTQNLAGNSYNAQNIPINFRTLQRRVDSLAEKGGNCAVEDRNQRELREYVENNCELIVVITKDISEAFQFFDSQNARGKKLYPHDLLKAYHLREMNDMGTTEIERVVKIWEDLNQSELSRLFSDYLYRLKEWTKGNKAQVLNEGTIAMFKGVARPDNYPYAQFYKGAYSYADMVNHSSVPFVTGVQKLNPFQLDTPIVAGKPFFDYAKHYFGILADIRNNDKYEGCFVNDNDIIKTLEQRTYKNGVGNNVTRLMLDTAILLYVDRFCSQNPSKDDLNQLEQFIVLAFIWAYSMRAQYRNVGWQVAQNYIMGNSEIINSFNIYKSIIEASSPSFLLSTLADKIHPLPVAEIAKEKWLEQVDDYDQDEKVYTNYLHYFRSNNFMEDKK